MFSRNRYAGRHRAEETVSALLCRCSAKLESSVYHDKDCPIAKEAHARLKIGEGGTRNAAPTPIP